MFGRVAHNGEQDQADKGFGNVGGLHDAVDAGDEVFGAGGDAEGDEHEGEGGGPGGEDGFFLLLGFRVVFGVGFVFGFVLAGCVVVVGGAGFLVEEFGVGFELEDEVEHVEQQQDDAGAAGEDGDGFVAAGAGAGHDVVQRCGDDERGAGYGHQ